MKLKATSIPIFALLCSCSQKVVVNQVCLNQDFPVIKSMTWIWLSYKLHGNFSLAGFRG